MITPFAQFDLKSDIREHSSIRVIMTSANKNSQESNSEFSYLAQATLRAMELLRNDTEASRGRWYSEGGALQPANAAIPLF